MYSFLTIGAFAVAVLIGAAAVGGQEKQHDDRTRGGYHLGPDDQIVLRVANVPDLSDKPLRIDTDGYINLPMIGRLRATGLTTEQLEMELKKHLKVYLEDPDVSVSVAEYHSQPVSVIGAVGSPGVQQLQGRKTLVEIISLAGGLRPDAAPVAKITRRLTWGRIPLPDAKDDPSGQFSIASVDIKTLIDAKIPEENIPIFPEDVISVPRAQLVYVLGDVTKAGALPLDAKESISVLEALSTAGGTLRTAASSKAKILRVVHGAPRRTELPVNLKQIQNGKAEDVQLIAGDILFIPGSDSKRITARAAEAAVQMGTVMLSYGIIR